MASVSETSLTTPDITECLICQEVIRDHSVLSCHHAVCVQCLNINKNNNNNCVNNEQDEELECPLCSRIFLISSDGISNSTNNFFMNQLLDGSKPNRLPSIKKTTFCELCSGGKVRVPSSSYCEECDQYFCLPCEDIHFKIKSAKSHRVIRSDDALSVDEKLRRCEEHPSEEKRLYCYNCKMIMCHKCTRKPNKHSLAEAKESMNMFREQLKENTEKLSVYTRRKQEVIIQLDADKKRLMENVDSIRNVIIQTYEQLLSQIQTQRNQLMTELNGFKDKVLKEIETRRTEIERQLLVRENFKKYCLAMMSKGITCDISHTAHDLHVRAEELVKTHGEQDGHKLSGVEITFKPSLLTADIINNFIGQLVLPIQEDRTVVDTRCEQKMNLEMFLNAPRLLHVKDNDRLVTGITVLGQEFFVVNKSSRVYVYSCDSFELIRQLDIVGSQQLGGIVSCVVYNCLYITDSQISIIYRYDVASKATTNWLEKIPCKTLSVNAATDHNVLVILYNNSRLIQEYSSDGCLAKEINLDISVHHLQHCIKLSTRDYVLSHSGWHNHRVCIVDDSGRILRSFGSLKGHNLGQLHNPYRIVVDKDDNIMITDYSNNRVLLLSSTLKYLGGLKIPGYSLLQPNTIYLDEANHRLYVAQCHERRMFILRC